MPANQPKLRLLTLMLGMAFYSVHADGSPEDVLIAPEGPPPGFENVALEETLNIVDVYFQDGFLVSVPVKFTVSTLTFTEPAELVKNLQGIEDSEVLLQHLSAPLSTHSDNLCPGQKVPYCEVLSPEIASITFDVANYRVDLFINPDLLPLEKGKAGPVLPPSSVDWSLHTQHHVLVSGAQASKVFSWQNTDVIAYRENVMTIKTFMQSNQSNGQRAENKLELRSFNVGHYIDDTFYQGGMIDTTGGSHFINSQRMLGVSVTNRMVSDTVGLTKDKSVSSMPLEVYLALPSSVRVFKDGNLIYMTHLPAGRHSLDTRAFPSGSYNITIEKTDQTGRVTEEQSFFVKSDMLPKLGRVEYFASMGVVQKTAVQSEEPFFQNPGFSSRPSLYANTLFSAGYNWGLSATVLGQHDQVFLAPELLYYPEPLHIAPSLLLSTSGTHGVGGRMNVAYKRWGLSANALRILYRHQYLGEDALDASSLVGSDSQLISSLSYSNEGFRANLSARWTKQRSAQIEESFGLTLTERLYKSATDDISASLSLTRSTTDRIMLISLAWQMYKTPYTSSIAGGYRHDSQGANDRPAYLDASIHRRFILESGNTVNLSGDAHYDEVASTLGVHSIYETKRMHVEAHVQHHAMSNAEDFFTYNASLDSHYSFAGDIHAIGYDASWRSGVMVDVKGEDNVDVDILVDGAVRGVARSGRAGVVYLSPYQSYHISIMPKGGKPYKYDHRSQRVTIYQGNFAPLTWKVEEEVLLFAQILDTEGQPLVNAFLKNSDADRFQTTDQYGFVQADIVASDTHLTFQTGKDASCEVTLPEKREATKDGFWQVEKLYCQ